MSTMEPDIWSYRHDSWSHRSIAGYDVHSLDGNIGTVDAATENVDPHCIVVRTGPWIFGKQLLLPVGVVESVDDDQHEVRVQLTKDQIKHAPELDETAVDGEATRSRLGEYYGRFFMNAP